MSIFQATRERHIREVLIQYFEEDVDALMAEQQSLTENEKVQSMSGIDDLPLAPCNKFLAKDVRMLLREAASKVSTQIAF